MFDWFRRAPRIALAALALASVALPAIGAPTPAPVAAPTPAPTPQVRTYVVVDGDTLSGISLKFYGTARRWPDIYQANRDILPNESVLRVGSTLRIP